jgi:hypothetical protein
MADEDVVEIILDDLAEISPEAYVSKPMPLIVAENNHVELDKLEPEAVDFTEEMENNLLTRGTKIIWNGVSGHSFFIVYPAIIDSYVVRFSYEGTPELTVFSGYFAHGEANKIIPYKHTVVLIRAMYEKKGFRITNTDIFTINDIKPSEIRIIDTIAPIKKTSPVWKIFGHYVKAKGSCGTL